MYGVIQKQQLMNDLLLKTKYVKEVYADQDFSFAKDGASFILLCSQEIPLSQTLFELNRIFSMHVDIYVTYDAFAAILQGKKTIWREGVWYDV